VVPKPKVQKESPRQETLKESFLKSKEGNTAKKKELSKKEEANFALNLGKSIEKEKAATEKAATIKAASEKERRKSHDKMKKGKL